MHIVLINSEYRSNSGLDHGGIATYTYAMANALAENGHSVKVLCRPGVVPDPLAPGVELHRFDYASPPRLVRLLDLLEPGQVAWERGFSRGALRAVRRLHDQQPVDAVEVPEYNGLAAAFPRSIPFRLVIHLHTPSYVVDRHNHAVVTSSRRQWYRYESAAMSRAHGIVSPTESLKTEICQDQKIPPDRISVIRHGIDTGPFDRLKSRASNPSEINILFAGRLERRKGAEILAASASRILDLDPRVTLSFAGETVLGESLDYRRSIDASLSPAQRERTWFLGPTSRHRLAALYRQSDILLFPSTYENSPYTILEALSARLPIAASNAPGVNEMIRHNENGLLFDPAKPQELVECVRLLVENPARRRELAENGYDYVKREHSPQRTAEQTVAFYASLRR